jgi:hypothetical protein
MQLPKRGFYSLNLVNSTEITVPLAKDNIEIDESLVRYRTDRPVEIGQWSKDSKNSIYIGKMDDPYTYACGVYFCKLI